VKTEKKEEEKMGSELGLSWEEIARVKRLDDGCRGWLKEEKGKKEKPPRAPFFRTCKVSEFHVFFPPLR
jgi:hypothetical protein